jgi:dihydrofolate reductase
MRKLIEATFVSLDGVVGSPESWAIPYWDEENKNFAHAQLSEVDAFLLGRVTYEMFAANWQPINGDPYIETINRLPKFVASTTLAETTWNASLIDGDVADEVSKLKDRPGGSIMKYGTGDLDRPLIQRNLIDEFHFSLFPMVVGRGRRLFEGIDTSHLELEHTATHTFGNGIVMLTYVPKVLM